MKLFKLKGLDYFVAAKSIERARFICIENSIGVTIGDLVESSINNIAPDSKLINAVTITQLVDNVKPSTNRELALEWWNNQNYSDQWRYYHILHDKQFSPAHSPKDLTGLEIESIWKSYSNSEKEFVDFEKVKIAIKRLSKINEYNIMTPSEKDLLVLIPFFEKLSQSSSFAHKAHKELKKLQ